MNSKFNGLMHVESKGLNHIVCVKLVIHLNIRLSFIN